MALEKAYLEVLNSGTELVRNGVHCYVTPRGHNKEFVILEFDKVGNLYHDRELRFNNANEAVQAFIAKTHGKEAV